MLFYNVKEKIVTLHGISFNTVRPPSEDEWEEIISEKPKAPTLEDLGWVSGVYIGNGYIGNSGDIFKCTNQKLSNRNHNIYPTEHYAESSLAERKLIFLRDSKFYRNGWKPDWGNINAKWCIVIQGNVLRVEVCYTNAQLFSFRDSEIAQRFLNEQRELLEIWIKKFD